MPSLLNPVRQLYGSKLASIIVRPMSMKFPDPPCKPINPNCHYIEDKYEHRCCVSRAAGRNPCVSVKPIRKIKKIEPPTFRSMWEPPCDTGTHPYCKDLLPRFDDMYYKPSNKWRCFQRTWVECPRINIRMKKICCLDGIEPPEVKKRIKEPCPRVTCTFDYARMRHICEKKKLDLENKCSKIHWPCCKPARCPPSCRQGKRPKVFNRLRTPYRCYSDTQKNKRPLRMTECTARASICEALAVQHRHKIHDLKPNSGCEAAD